jgi:hypothetical protein
MVQYKHLVMLLASSGSLFAQDVEVSGNDKMGLEVILAFEERFVSLEDDLLFSINPSDGIPNSLYKCLISLSLTVTLVIFKVLFVIATHIS